MSADYPNNYKVPAFPAGSALAISRWMGIATQMVFLLIVCVCGLIFWARISQKTEPFIIAVDDLTGKWDMVKSYQQNQEYKTTEMLQIATVNKFVNEWFCISPDLAENDARWADCQPSSDCPVMGTTNEKSGIKYGDAKFKMCCMMGSELFNTFLTTVVPEYSICVENGETWKIKSDTVNIVPAANQAAWWRVTAQVKSNIETFYILGYAHVARNTDMYKETNGYYIDEFFAYRIR